MKRARESESEEVIEAVINGIDKAQSDYRKAAWTALCECPEYFITTSIFYALSKIGKDLTLESRPKDLQKWLNEKNPVGRPKSVEKLEGHIDICIWDTEKNRPRVPIEVKKRADLWKTTTGTTQIRRVVGLLCSKGRERFTFGLLASCIHTITKEDIRTTCNSVEDFVSETVKHKDAEGKLEVNLVPSEPKRLKLKVPEDPESQNYWWQPVVFEICPKIGHGRR